MYLPNEISYKEKVICSCLLYVFKDVIVSNVLKGFIFVAGQQLPQAALQHKQFPLVFLHPVCVISWPAARLKFHADEPVQSIYV